MPASLSVRAVCRLSHENYRPHPKLAKALDVLFILHADHELNAYVAQQRTAAYTGSSVLQR